MCIEKGIEAYSKIMDLFIFKLIMMLVVFGIEEIENQSLNLKHMSKLILSHDIQ